ncbi:MAG TPA: SDR family oxidoreductase, partial [Porticoccaceae bacterium]
MKGLVEGKVVLITGAGSGVGRAACVLFAEHGAKVVAADINGETAQETVSDVTAQGGEAVGVQCDVASAESVNAAVQCAVDQFGRLDILYNNAGITITPRPGEGLKTLLDATDADMDRLQNVNVKGVMHGCQAAIRQFKAQGGGGVIVNTASVAGLIGYGGVVYGATKGAVAILTKALALEVAGDGIRVNAVCPAGMPTNFVGPGVASSQAARDSMGRAHPLGRAIEPRECASAALFLASDLASNITGVNLPVDGGLSAG